MPDEGELERKVIQSMQEGYSEDQIMRAMSNLGFEESRIKKVISEAEQDLNGANNANNSLKDNSGSSTASAGDQAEPDFPSEVSQQDGKQQPERPTQGNQSSQDIESGGKSPIIAALLGFVGFIGYLYVGRKKLALLNFVTMNYLSLGFIIAPIHCYLIADEKH